MDSDECLDNGDGDTDRKMNSSEFTASFEDYFEEDGYEKQDFVDSNHNESSASDDENKW
jgi:hypothetical protein